MDRILSVCRALAVRRAGKPVVVLGSRDAHLFTEGALVPLGCPPQEGYEGYRAQMRLIGDALRARGLSADYQAYWPVEHRTGLAHQVVLQYTTQKWLRSPKPPLGVTAAL